jgi:hypothetical protein
MAERFDLGGAAFHLVITSDQFKRALTQAETDARAASQKIEAALNGIGRGGAITPKVNAAPASAAFNQVITQAKAAQAAASFTATPTVNTRPAQTAISGLAGSLKGALAFGIGAAGVTVGISAIGEALGGIVGATREAERAQFALGKVYGDTSGQILTSTNAIADATGRSNTESQRAAVAISTLAKNYGATAEEQEILLKRTADLATIHGLTLPDAAKRAADAMRGEAEASELLGVSLQSDAVRATAQMTAEQRKNWETLDLVTKRQIILKEFLLQTADASGAAAEQTNSFDSALTRLGGSANNFGVTIGQATSGPMVRFINQVGEGIERLDEWAKALGGLQEAINANSLLSPLHQRPETLSGATPLIPTPSLATIGPQLGPSAAEVRATRLQDVAEQKTQIERLAAAAREAQAEATRSALDDLSKRREAAQDDAREQRERITDVRDADIAASNARKDAALAAIDREAQGRSRARTQEDRARAAAQEAELRGLEAIHDANVKGADEAIATIQKRRDEAVNGLDAELRAVERRRDTALRAIDEETRAESRRHSEALRNIDLERDRKLGIIDAELAKLDAAALRDQRAQTDQSLARSLADARRDRREAENPEERARAQRAVADAEAAIRREAVNRQREDQRSALRAAADQIRLAAETAKRVEDARNVAASESLSARKQTANDQAAADTERLQAVKVRVEEQTKIELDSIRERVDAEKVAYDQTVQDARDAHQEINDAVADRRADEDIELAARRALLQEHYKAEQDNIKAVADTKLDQLEQGLRDTTTNLDKEKEAWSNWARHVESEIKAAIAAGDPSRIRGLTATPPELQNAGAGPGEPPGRDESLLLLTAPAKAAAAVAAGFAEGIASEASVAAVTGATNELIQGGVIDEAKRLLAIESPSRVFVQFGTDTAQGFLDGYQSLDLTAPIRAPFEESIRWLDGLPAVFRINGMDTANAWKAAYEEVDLYAVGRLPFENLEAWMNPGFANQMTANGVAAGNAWESGYAANDIFVSGRRPFEQLHAWMGGVPDRFRVIGQTSGMAFVTSLGSSLLASLNTQQQRWWSSFEQVGENLWVSLRNGWIDALTSNPLQAPTVAGSGGDGTTSATSSTAGTGSLGTLGGGFVAFTGQKFGVLDAEKYLLSKGYTDDTQAFNELFDRLFALQAQGYAPPPDMVVTGRKFGGTLDPYAWSWVGEGGRPELIRAGRDGATVRSYADSMAMLGGARGTGSTTLNMPISIDARGVTNAEQMFQAVAPRIVRTVVNIIDAAERNAPDPAPDTLGGA